MYQKMVEKLIEGLSVPESINNSNPTIKMDLILEGGAFNGSYMLGILYFLKNMEEKKKIKIERISGVSIGAMLGLIYQLDRLDFAVAFYKNVYTHLKKKKNLIIVHTFCDEIRKFIPDDFYLKINRKFFVTYYDFKKGKKIVKSTYKNNQDILNTVIKSSYIAFICGKTCFYKNRYMDGLFPYIFNQKERRKCLYINLSHYDKIFDMFIIKKEKNNIQRILIGIVDAFSFFDKGEKTMMCSYLNQWNIINHSWHFLKISIERLIFWSFWFFYLLERYVLDEMSHTFYHQLFYRLLHNFNKTMIEYLCV